MKRQVTEIYDGCQLCQHPKRIPWSLPCGNPALFHSPASLYGKKVCGLHSRRDAKRRQLETKERCLRELPAEAWAHVARWFSTFRLSKLVLELWKGKHALTIALREEMQRRLRDLRRWIESRRLALPMCHHDQGTDGLPPITNNQLFHLLKDCTTFAIHARTYPRDTKARSLMASGLLRRFSSLLLGPRKGHGWSHAPRRTQERVTYGSQSLLVARFADAAAVVELVDRFTIQPPRYGHQFLCTSFCLTKPHWKHPKKHRHDYFRGNQALAVWCTCDVATFNSYIGTQQDRDLLVAHSLDTQLQLKAVLTDVCTALCTNQFAYPGVHYAPPPRAPPRPKDVIVIE